MTTNPSRIEIGDSPVLVARNYRLYLFGIASWQIALAIQFVLLPALVALVLRAPPAQVGTAQMAQLLPMVFLLLHAGALADRVDPRRIVLLVQALAIGPPLVLAALLHFELASYPLLICYALLMGTLSAVITPAREGLLPRIAPGSLQRAVTAASGVQFGVQVLGSLLVFLMPQRYGPVPVLLAQSLLYLLGAAAFSRLRLPPVPRAAEHGRATFAMIGDGLRVALASRRLRAVMVLNVVIGVLYLGVFLVGIPLLVRDVHHGTIREMALASVANQLGTIVATAVLLRIGGVRRKGRALAGALLLNAATIAVLGVELTFATTLAVIFLSGICGGVGLVMGRTLVQEAAPDTHRSRVMALYSLSALGGAPIGAQAVGSVAGHIGVQYTLILAAALMAGTTVAIALSTGLARDGQSGRPWN